MRGYTVPLHDGSRQAGTLALLAYRGSAQRAVSAVLTAIGWASALGILFATLLGLTVVRRSLRPLGRIARQIEAVESAGELSRRIEHAGADDEVGRQAAAFDRMLARLEQAFASQ